MQECTWCCCQDQADGEAQCCKTCLLFSFSQGIRCLQGTDEIRQHTLEKGTQENPTLLSVRVHTLSAIPPCIQQTASLVWDHAAQQLCPSRVQATHLRRSKTMQTALCVNTVLCFIADVGSLQKPTAQDGSLLGVIAVRRAFQSIWPCSVRGISR